jgi:hypothetical protein
VGETVHSAGIIRNVDFVLGPVFNSYVTSGSYMSHLQSLFKSAGLTVSHFFSMLPSTLKYLYSVEPCIFPRNCIVTGSTEQRYFKVDGSMEKKWDTVIPADLKRLFLSGTYTSRWSRKG